MNLNPLDKRTKSTGIILAIFISTTMLLSIANSVQAYTFPSGDWWAIDSEDHNVWAIEDMPSEGKIWWRAQFFWDENKWPEDHWEGWTYVDEWYMHEFRRFEYKNVGDAYDYDVMDSDYTYYTTLPAPHDIEVEERIEPNWLYDPFDNDEEIEIICKEPCDIIEDKLYVARVTFNKKASYDDYTIVLESEHGNHVTSPPSDWEEIERVHYTVPSALSMLSIGTSYSFQPRQVNGISEREQIESPILDVRYNGYRRPFMTTVVQGNYSVEVLVSEYGHFSSTNFVDNFIAHKNRQLNLAKEGKSKLDAVVSFKQSLTIDEVIALANETSLDIDWIRYLSSKGGGKISFDHSDDILGRIGEMDAVFKKDYGSDFNLVDSVGAVKATIPVESIDLLRNKEKVLLVDPGPVEIVNEIASKYPNTLIQIRWYDIFQEYALLTSKINK